MSGYNIPRVGDILIDCHGNKMVVLDLLDSNSGDCYVLLNGRVKLVNAMSSSIVEKEEIESKRTSASQK